MKRKERPRSARPHGGRSTSAILVCAVCSADYRPERSRETTSKFCSRACNGRGHTMRYAEKQTSLFWSRIAKAGEDECWVWTASRKQDGYGVCRIAGSSSWYPAHRRAYELSIGKIPEGKVVRHSCDNPPCCNPKHLSIGTHADNVSDKLKRGRQRGMSLEIVRDIQLSLSSGESQTSIAGRHGITQSAVSLIKLGKNLKRFAA